jgi:fluoroquinolone resistance protein
MTVLEGIDYSEKKPELREFDDYTFVNCNFSKSDLRGVVFLDCRFRNCNLSLAHAEDAGIKNVAFTDCKLMGFDFSKCSDFLFSVSFENCQLDYGSFYKKKLKKVNFSKCSVKNVDFTEADLSQGTFDQCDLQDAVFIQSILEKTDFRTARNYAFDPESNRMKKAMFSLPDVVGLLAKYNIVIE